MKILLRHTETGLLYAGPGNWTDTHAAAVCFESVSAALDLCQSGLGAVEVVMHFDDPQFEIPLSIAGTGG